MRITYSNTTLASPSLAIGRVGPLGLSWNGEPIIDVADFFRAALATVYGRGDGPEEFSFSVWAHFTTEAQVLNFCALHRTVLPVQADLTLIDDAATVALVMADAIRQVTIGQVIGLSVQVGYRFIGSGFTSEAIPEDLEENTDRMKVGKETLTINAEEVTVTFASPFASEPRYVNLNIERPTGQVPVAVVGYRDVTAASFIAILSYPLPTGTYFGRWQAVL